MKDFRSRLGEWAHDGLIHFPVPPKSFAVNTLLKPERLCPGDIVGLVVPASPPPDPRAVDRAAEALERYGFKPKLGRHVHERHGFLAGSDRDRATDIMELFADKSVKAIMSLRGGHGTSRLAALLDYEIIRENAKIFTGYSDITFLHNAFTKKAGMISFHAPMLNGGLQAKDVPEFTRSSFLRTVMEPRPAGSIASGEEKKDITILRGGVAEGPLIGGNLSLLCASIGTPFEPAFEGKILFFEDIGEKPYRLDRMLTHLLNAGLLQQVAGVAVGVNRDCEDPKKPNVGEYRQTSADVIKERLSELKVPVVINLPFGHVDINATLPIGVQARLDGDNGDLVITESAVN
jgi:muramoyltetrapeptide carboxypeptidase